MKIKNIATAGERCFCPGCVREIDEDNEGCPHCEWGMYYKGQERIPTLGELLTISDRNDFNNISPRFFKFLVAYGRATYERQ